MLGNDPDQLDGLGDLLTRSAERLGAIGTEVSVLLAGAGWEGCDAEEFRWQWHHQLTGILHSTAAQNHEAARVLHTNAQEQRAASSDHAGLFPGGFGGAVPGDWSVSCAETAPDIGWELIGLLGTVVGANSLLADTFKAFGKPPPQLASFAAGVKGLDNILKGPGIALSALSLVDDMNTFATGLACGGNRADTVNAGVDTVLGVVELGLGVGALVFPPLGAAAVVATAAHFAFDAVVAIDPELPTRIADGMSDFADTVADSVGDAVTGGVDAVANLFGF
ncbi:hypothetical protein [Actinophytocola sp.]|uniref:hypothetical protein n=1 Tax=Actinophytocola sp. TaxID=1872138 RepID=UPI002ED02A8A